jgi:YVTN family beta-propeller protein
MKTFGLLITICLMLATASLLLSWAGTSSALAGMSTAPVDLDFTLVATIPLGAGAEPHGVTLDTANNIIYVANYGAGNISVVDGNTLSVTDVITISGEHPDGIAYNPVDEQLYVGSDDPSTDTGDAYLVITPTTKISATMGSVYNPAGLVVSSTGKVYIANGADYNDHASVTQHPDQLIVNSGDSGTDYAHMAFDSQGKLYVTAHNYGNSGVAHVGADGVAWDKVDLTGSLGPWGIAWDEISDQLFVAAMDSGNLAVVETAPFAYVDVIEPPEPASLAMVAIDPDRRLLFVTQNQVTDCSSSGDPEKLYIYDLLAESWLAVTVTLGQDPDQGIAIDTNRRRLYVTNRCSDSLSVIEYGASPTYLPLIVKET